MNSPNDTVQVNGVTLTRAQIEDALKRLNETPYALDMHEVLLGNGQHISIQCRLGPCAFQNKGIFLSSLPIGYEWATVIDELSSHVLIIRKKASS